MAKKLELKFLTSANTELIVSIADPKDGLALAAVQAEAAKIMPVLANGKGVGGGFFRKGCHGDYYGRRNSLILKEVYNKDIYGKGKEGYLWQFPNLWKKQGFWYVLKIRTVL
jgi:putative NADH-dependent dehydrogenase